MRIARNTVNLVALQFQVRNWAARNFPSAMAWEPLVGLQEELGELSHAFLKRHQGIRLEESHSTNIRDAVGDIVIYLAHFCHLEEIDLERCIEDAWRKVEKRDWVAHRESADVSGWKTEIDRAGEQLDDRKRIDRVYEAGRAAGLRERTRSLLCGRCWQGEMLLRGDKNVGELIPRHIPTCPMRDVTFPQRTPETQGETLEKASPPITDPREFAAFGDDEPEVPGEHFQHGVAPLEARIWKLEVEVREMKERWAGEC